ncbi:MAG TPA: hypothetical protein VFY23_03525 [Candidatus Limnocylindrales bacterium]|nr:hypothetical protein [Candidatus Limnocylindrales bacterium]
MATRQDFTDDEWATLQRGVTGSGMLVSISDRDFTDSFGEAGAMGKFLAGQHVASASALVRELVPPKGSGFGLTAGPDVVRDQTLAAVRDSIALLEAKSPEDVEAYRELVRGLMQAVAEAKSGTSPIEAQAQALVEEALGA